MGQLIHTLPGKGILPMFIVIEHGPVEAVRRWDRLFPIGIVVKLQGRSHKTESHAGLGLKRVPCVFLEGIELPVPLSALDVEGYHKVPLKRGSEAAGPIAHLTAAVPAATEKGGHG